MNRSPKSFDPSEIIYRINSSDRVKGLSCTTDRDGNVYVLGQFFKNMFSDNILLTADESGIFLAQIDRDGRWRWATAIHTHTSANDIRMSCEVTFHKKNLYSAFVIDNPGTGVRLGFVVRTDRGGNIIYKTKFTGRLEPTIRISVDDHGNAYIVNSYTGLLELSDTVKLPEVEAEVIEQTGQVTGTTTSGLTVPLIVPAPVVAAQPVRGYVAKININGDWLWAREISMGPVNTSNLRSIATRSDGTSYVTGWFTGDVRLDKIKIRGSRRRDIRHFIIAEIDSKGDWKRADSFRNGMGTGIALNKREKEIYVTGGFIDKFKLGGSRVKKCGTNIFVAKLDRHFNTILIKAIEYDTDFTNININIVVDKNGNSYIDGPLFSPIIFGKTKLIPKNILEDSIVTIFIAKLSPDGCWVWANVIIGSESTTSKDLTVDKFKNLYITGAFKQNLIIDCLKEFGPTTSLFLVRLRPRD